MSKDSIKKDFLLHLNQLLYVIFLKHPKENGLTYFEHFFRALSISKKMFKGFISLIIHSIFPCFFEKTGSDIIKDLYLNHFNNNNNNNNNNN